MILSVEELGVDLRNEQGGPSHSQPGRKEGLDCVMSSELKSQVESGKFQIASVVLSAKRGSCLMNDFKKVSNLHF